MSTSTGPASSCVFLASSKIGSALKMSLSSAVLGLLSYEVSFGGDFSKSKLHGAIDSG